jgi:hypothetical protein
MLHRLSRREEPQRAVQTDRYTYMRRYDTDHQGRVLADLGDSLTKDMLVAAGWGEVNPPTEALFDLWLHPSEGTNRIDDPALADLRTRLHDWMVLTEDPLLDGPVASAEGTVVNAVDQISPADPRPRRQPGALPSPTEPGMARKGRIGKISWTEVFVIHLVSSLWMSSCTGTGRRRAS